MDINDTDYVIHVPLAEEFRCSVCYPLNKTYKRHGDLSKHVRRYHLKTLKFSCRSCNVLFETVKKCKAHLKTSPTCDEHMVTPFSPAGLGTPPAPPKGALQVKRCRLRPVNRSQNEPEMDETENPEPTPRPRLQSRRLPSSSSSGSDEEVFAPIAGNVVPATPVIMAPPQVRQTPPDVAPVVNDAVHHIPSPAQVPHPVAEVINDDNADPNVIVNNESITSNNELSPTPHVDNNNNSPQGRPVRQQPPREAPNVVQNRKLNNLQRKWCAHFNNNITNPDDIERSVSSLLNEIRPEQARQPERNNRPRVPRRPRRNGPQYDAASAARIQRLYRGNRKRAFVEITGNNSTFCQIPTQQLHRHFTDVHAATPAGADDVRIPPTAPAPPALNIGQTNPFANEITAEEVWSRITRCSNNSPGPDGIKYEIWRKKDPGSHIMAAIFNAVRRLKYIPLAWRTSNTILIHKKGDTNDPCNWRPIALSDTIAKTYTSVLANRLSSWAQINDRVSPGQKGFMPIDGCSEHNFLLQSVITDARRRQKRCSIAWLDLTNAFGSVPHETLFDALSWTGLDEDAVSEIRLLYSDCSTRIRTTDGFTNDIPIQSGVKQGCPLSPIVFNLAMEPLLRSVMAERSGYPLAPANKIDILAYADDLVLISETPEKLQALLNAASDAANHLGFSFNARKCASLDLDGRTRRAFDTRFTIQRNQTLPTLGPDDYYDYLGTPIGYHTSPSPTQAIEKVDRDLESIDTSLLAPWQKINAVNTFLIPVLSFHLHNGVVEKRPLTKLDKKITACVKKWMNLPQRASAEIVRIPYKQGGAGIMPLNTLADIGQIVHGYRLLRSTNLQHIANDGLRGVVRRRLRRDNISLEDQANYLNGDMTGDFAMGSSDIGDIWTRLRVATTHLRSSIPISWEENATGDALDLCINGNRLQLRDAEHLIRASVQENFRRRLLSKPDQGKVYEVTSSNPAPNHFLSNGSFTRFADWRFVHRARLGVVPLNGARRFGPNGDKRCRRCGYQNETLPHVLCHCQPHMVTVTKRHDAIVQRIVKALRPPPTTRVRVNQQVPGCDEALRPDIVLIDEQLKTAVIVDVATPFENRYEALQQARRQKQEKYAGVAANLAERGLQVTVDGFIVGALGGWDPGNEAVLRKLKVSWGYCKLMRKLMASDCIKWSRDIYVEHMTGHRQY